MPQAKDGSKHASHSRAHLHDEIEEGKKKKPAGEAEEPKEEKEPKAAKPGAHAEPDGDEGAGEDSQEPIEDMVAQHGPADKIEMDSAEGVHHVTSHHGGMKHKSTHTDSLMAGHHMMKAMGHQPPPQAPAAADAGMGGDATGMGGGMGGGSIPGMM